jgi:hypothetical protein
MGKAKNKAASSAEMVAVEMSDTTTAATEPLGYTKQQILSSQRFADSRDVLSALMDDGRQYTVEQVEKVLHGFLQKEAK